MLVLLCIILNHINKSYSDCVISNHSQLNTWERKLHKDLQCNYYIPDSPKPNGTVNVYLRFMMRSCNFYSNEEVLGLNSWVYMTWIDERLKWNKSDYDGINRTVMMSSHLWLPGLRLINIANGDDFERFFFLPCQIWSVGKVLCVPRTKHEARCSTKLTYWPYDVQKCTLQFGAWERSGPKIVFKFSKKASVLMSLFGGEWDVIDYDQKSNPNSESQLNITITLQRQALSLSAIIVHPSLILTVLNVASIMLEPRNNTRLWLVYFSLACHFLFLTVVNWEIPKRSMDSPIIILYYRGSLIVTIIIILLTHVLTKISKSKKSTLWVRYVNDTVFNSRFSFIAWPYYSENFGNVQNTEELTKFVHIVSNISAVVIIIVYIGLLSSFMPMQRNV